MIYSNKKISSEPKITFGPHEKLEQKIKVVTEDVKLVGKYLLALDQAMHESPPSQLRDFNFTEWLFEDVIGINESEWKKLVNAVEKNKNICTDINLLRLKEEEEHVEACQSVVYVITQHVIPRLRPFFDDLTSTEKDLLKSLTQEQARGRLSKENEEKLSRLEEKRKNFHPNAGHKGPRGSTFLSRVFKDMNEQKSSEIINGWKTYFNFYNSTRMTKDPNLRNIRLKIVELFRSDVKVTPELRKQFAELYSGLPTSDQKKFPQLQRLTQKNVDRFNRMKDAHDMLEGPYDAMKNHMKKIKDRFIELLRSMPKLEKNIKEVQSMMFTLRLTRFGLSKRTVHSL